MKDVYNEAIPMEMGSKNPTIPLKSKDEVMGEEMKQWFSEGEVIIFYLSDK